MTTTRPELDSAAAVLELARDSRAAADRAEADVLLAAVTWAEQHPPESIHVAATWSAPGGDTELILAGEGAPLVCEFSVAEFALALGMSTDSGKALIGHALELKYRLPRHWARTQTRRTRPTLAPWRARRVAQATLGLSPEAAAYVDAQVAPFAHKIGLAQLDRVVEEAIARFMPDLAEANAEKAADGRHISFHHQQVSFTGTTTIEGELDLADALDLDAAITRGAEALRAAGSTDSLDVRRAIAAGELARRQLALDLSAAATEARSSRVRVEAQAPTGGPLRPPLRGRAHRPTSRTGLELARVENHRQGVTADQVRTWCANPDTTVTVKPVIDLAEHIHVEAYEVPERLAEQTELRDLSCVFPWCTRPARRCDHDHAIPYDAGGTTCSCNIAPLCRRHHRLKTHSAWDYTVLEPGSFAWTSPHGYHYLRDHAGTLDVTPERPAPPTDPPHF